MTRISEYLLYLVYAVVVGGGLGVAAGVFYGCYVLIKKSVVSGLLVLGASAAGASFLYVAALALIAVAAFVTDGANGSNRP
jgi:hypothetical protein